MSNQAIPKECPNCGADSVTCTCGYIDELRGDMAIEEDAVYDAERECDPYTAIGESPFGLPGGGKSL